MSAKVPQRHFKEALRSLPVLPPAYRGLRDFLYRRDPAARQREFRRIFRANSWSGAQSHSGRGSSLEETASIRAAVPDLLANLHVTRLVDAPCGDFHWLRTVDLGGIEYIGIDIVRELVAENQKRYGSDTISFQQRDIVADPLPRADLVICRDCLVHLPFADALKVLANFRANGSSYLLTTTFPTRRKNRDVRTGGWRPLNLQLPPFDFPDPLLVLNENCQEGGGRFSDKSLGLWSIEVIPR